MRGLNAGALVLREELQSERANERAQWAQRRDAALETADPSVPEEEKAPR
jgi:hypothetical protein